MGEPSIKPFFIFVIYIESGLVSRNRQQVPLVAFITFNDDIASNIILDQYNKMSALKYYFGNHR